jgi:hypothetical protein
MRSTMGRSALTIQSTEHGRIHAGEMFTAGVNNAALGAAGFLYIQLNVAAGFEVHAKAVEFYNSLAATFDLLEAPTVTDGVTALVPFNRDRTSTKAPNSLLFSNPTSITPTTILEALNFTGSLLNNIGPQNNDLEWILKPSTKYIFRLQNNGGGAATAFMKIHFYEEKV